MLNLHLDIKSIDCRSH